MESGISTLLRMMAEMRIIECLSLKEIHKILKGHIHLKEKYQLDFAGGLGHLQGKIFRFGHMGYCFPSDILQAVSLIEAGLQDFSYSFEPGAGVAAAQNVFLHSLRK